MCETCRPRVYGTFLRILAQILLHFGLKAAVYERFRTLLKTNKNGQKQAKY